MVEINKLEFTINVNSLKSLVKRQRIASGYSCLDFTNLNLSTQGI